MAAPASALRQVLREGPEGARLIDGFRTAKTVRQEDTVKEGIHPKLVPARIICGCGNVIHTYSTKPEIHVEVCSKCHPFYTGQQRFVDTEGRVERFQRRFGDSYRKGR
ncbi:hypothetical protein FJNA_03660 [Thermus sp. FJN-A]